MAHIYKQQAAIRPNFLDSAIGLVQKTCTVAAAGVVADAYGYKTVEAGTVYPSNDSAAIGIIFEDVDVTHGDHEGSLIVAGRIIEANLPVALDSDAKTALEAKGFVFTTVDDPDRSMA